jgi:two-component system, cell cycle sensor histidine kinase and response regulator CckA
LTLARPTPLAGDRIQLLDEVAGALAPQDDWETALRVVAGCAVPRFADLVLLVVQGGSGIRLEVAHRDPEQNTYVAGLVRTLLPAIRRLAEEDLGQGRQFRWLPRVARATPPLNREADLFRLLQSLEVASLIVVPLRASGVLMGAIAFTRRAGGTRYNTADLAVAQVVARRSAAVIQKAEMHGRELDEQTRRNRLEVALQKWTQVFDHAGWGAAIVDGQDQRIEAVNPAFARLHGFPGVESLAGRLFSDVLSAEHANEPAPWSAAGQRSPYESDQVRANGTQFPVLTNVTPLANDTGATSHVVTIQDLTDLKRTEERLRRAQRLEAVGRLAGGVAHEVNNMMTIIMGFSDLLARSGDVPVQRHRDIEEIRKAATRAGKITQQLLAFSRQQILQPADLQLNDVVSDLVPVLRLLLPANIELESALAPLGPLVHVDRAQLDQVIINLAFNARDAMAAGGTLRLVTDSRRLAEDDGRRLIGIPIPHGQYALISVIDTGHGMDALTLRQVFEPFFTTKPAGSGTGLGLATVYGIVKQSGGYVWVESASDTGTTVTVCLPQVRAEAAVPGDQTPEDLPVECRPGTVLVIEDEEGVRDLVHRVLQEQGHQVLDAPDGDRAISMLEEFGSELDLVLSDIVVPGLGAGELDKKIRELRPDLPIVYMSGYARDEMVDRGLVDPDRPFLQKPFTGEELSELVCRQLGPAVGARGGEVTS